MIAQNLNIPDFKFMSFNNQLQGSTVNTKSSLVGPLVKVLAQRNATINWLYHAQKTLKFSRSSLFLGIALLDKLLACGMSLTDSNYELVGGSLTLVATKFNEVYPVTVRKLNALSDQHYSMDQYIETESNLLAMVGFDLSPSDSIYEELAEL